MMTTLTTKFNTITLLVILLAATLVFSISFSSCSKEGKNEKDNHCPVVAASAVPQIVRDSFAVRYPALTVNTWFQKDSVGYCAYFIHPVDQKKLAEFTRTGSFVSEETDMNHDGNFEDSTGTSDPKIPGTCECEIPE